MNHDASEATIACSLQSSELGDRLAVWEQLARKALRETSVTEEGVRLLYAGSEQTKRALEQLARLESECCPFAKWRVTSSGDEILVDVTSTGDGVAVLHALFGIP